MMNSKEINKIIEQIKDNINPEKIILFGSYAAGNPKQDSDIDLLIVANLKLPPPKRFSYIRKILSNFPFSFDIVVKTPEEYNRQKNSLNHIVYFVNKYGKVLYEKKT